MGIGPTLIRRAFFSTLCLIVNTFVSALKSRSALRLFRAFYSPASSPQLFIAELLTAEIQKLTREQNGIPINTNLCTGLNDLPQ